MKMVRHLFAITAVALCVAASAAFAAPSINFDEDARFAEGNPPVIPHRVEEGTSGEQCLACHRSGLGKASLCPHVVRLNCTQCHVRAVPGAVNGEERSGRGSGSCRVR